MQSQIFNHKMWLNLPKILTAKNSLGVSTCELVQVIFNLFQTAGLFYQSKKEWQIPGGASIGSLLFPTLGKTNQKDQRFKHFDWKIS